MGGPFQVQVICLPKPGEKHRLLASGVNTWFAEALAEVKRNPIGLLKQ